MNQSFRNTPLKISSMKPLYFCSEHKENYKLFSLKWIWVFCWRCSFEGYLKHFWVVINSYNKNCTLMWLFIEFKILFALVRNDNYYNRLAKINKVMKMMDRWIMVMKKERYDVTKTYNKSRLTVQWKCTRISFQLRSLLSQMQKTGITFVWFVDPKALLKFKDLLFRKSLTRPIQIR